MNDRINEAKINKEHYKMAIDKFYSFLERGLISPIEFYKLVIKEASKFENTIEYIKNYEIKGE